MSEMARQSRPAVCDSTIAPDVANKAYGPVYGVDWIWHADGIGFLYPSSKPLGPIPDVSSPGSGDAENAARYRWLRANAVYGRMEAELSGFALNCDEPENEWDAAIDAAMSQPLLSRPTDDVGNGCVTKEGE